MSTPLKKTPIIVEDYLQIFDLQNTVLELVAADASQQEILNKLCLMQEALLPGSSATVMLLNAGGDRLHVMAAPSLDEAARRELDGLKPEDGYGSCASAVASGKAQFVVCTLDDERWAMAAEFAEKYHLKSCWSMPVVIDERVIGSFALTSFEERRPAPFAKMMLSVAARIVSIVVRREEHRRRIREGAERIQLLAKVFESIGEGIIVTDRNNAVIEVNAAFELLTGYREADVRGKLPTHFLDPDVEYGLNVDMLRSIASEGVWRRELLLRKADGTRAHEWVSASKLLDAQGRHEGYLYVLSDIDELKMSQEKLVEMAFHDALTGLANRALLMERIAHFVARAERNSASHAAVLFLDLDRFKYFNDTFGHASGDHVLIEIAARLKRQLRKGDTIARFGGDEFVILLEDEMERDVILKIAVGLLEAIKVPVEIKGHRFVIGGSIGIAIFPNDGKDAETLLKHADTAMYEAKQNREHISFYRPQMSEHTMKSLVLEKELYEAFAREEFDVCYQPILQAKSGMVYGAEALVRWHHPERGTIYPAEFITFAEEIGLIAKLDEWVLDHVIADLRRWHAAAEYAMVPVSVNISGRHINQEDVTGLIRILNKSALAREYIGLELTETYLMQFAEETVVQLERLKHAGVRLAMDDFGTGYSSLGYLKRFKMDTIKIDMLLVRDIERDVEDRSIADAIINMGHSLGMKIVAEGVETEGQKEILTQLGCDALQGFYFDRAIPEARFAEKYLKVRT